MAVDNYPMVKEKKTLILLVWWTETDKRIKKFERVIRKMIKVL